MYGYYYLFGCIIFGVICGFISQNRHNTFVNGFLGGFFLGIIGLIFVAVERPGKHECPVCKSYKSEKRAVCKKCEKAGYSPDGQYPPQPYPPYGQPLAQPYPPPYQQPLTQQHIQPASQQNAPDAATVEEKLKQLSGWLESGIITQAEYDESRKKILGL